MTIGPPPDCHVPPSLSHEENGAQNNRFSVNGIRILIPFRRAGVRIHVPPTFSAVYPWSQLTLVLGPVVFDRLTLGEYAAWNSGGVECDAHFSVNEFRSPV
jgi:hypothetical protein